MTSCVPSQMITTPTREEVQVPKFTSVENVLELKLNSSLETVVSTLGSKPYNILINQKDGYTIYMYYYKLKDRELSYKLVNSIGGETTGTEVYNPNTQTLFLLFKDNKLESFITTEGELKSSNIIRMNNTLYSITKKEGHYLLEPYQETSNVKKEETISETPKQAPLYKGFKRVN